LLAFFFPTVCGAAETTLTPGSLACELLVDPLGIDVAQPRLSWLLHSDERGQAQTAYQVLVTSSRDLLARNHADLWNSGRTSSDATVDVRYSGKPLASSQQVFWKVRVWSAAGEVSPWSPVATWTMGILGEKGWNAGTRWITDPALSKWVRPRLGYRSEDASDENTVKWVQVDLGASYAIDAVRLYAIRHSAPELLGFPRRFKLEAADNPVLRGAVLVADQTAKDFPSAGASVIDLPASSMKARFLRLTAARLRTIDRKTCLALSQIEVISGGRNVAAGGAVTASDSIEQAPWGASAITDGLGIPGMNPRANGTLLLRREFIVRPGLRRALAHISGLGHYELSVNDRRVDGALLRPGWTDYRKTCLYDTHDLSALLNAGANAVGISLAGGMYNVQEGRYVKFVSPFRPLVAFGEIRLEYADGTVETISTDSRWRVMPGPITFSNVYGGEDYDARREPSGWSSPGFNDSAWTAAVETEGPGGILHGVTHASPPFGVFETLKPRAVRELRQGTLVYDFGQNASIMPRLRVRGPAGAVVKIVPAELVKPDGSVDRGSAGGGDAWWRYTLAGRTAGEEWFPSFFYHGSRYLQVELAPPQGGGPLPVVEALEVSVVHSDSPAAGEFSCSNDLFNRIRTLVRWAQRSNLAHVITDCPHREKLGWLEQYHLNGPSLRYEFDLTRLYAKTFGDMADAQQADGLVPDIAPEYVIFAGGFRDSPEWGSALILAAWQHSVWTGDDAPLRRYYPAMQRYVAYLAGRSEGNIVSHGLGDWFDIGPNRPGASQLTPIPLTATAFYYECARTLARIAMHLGNNADARRYETQAAQIKDGFNRKFFNADAGVYATGSQTAQALPLVLGLVEPARRAGVLDMLARDVRGRGNAITAGDVGYRYLLRALADGGRSDVIFDMNNQSEKPGYGYQLARGATSLTEAWDAAPHASQNHFMLGQIMEWFYHDLAGIRPDENGPGFKKIILHPSPAGDITWVKASHRTARGIISVEWHRENGMFSYAVTIPPNTTATVFVPASDAASVSESDRPAARAPGVKFLRMEAGAAVYTISSGTYRFSALQP
jgi:hypothetical protein